jgi:M6 family metalloprotease-like protein
MIFSNGFEKSPDFSHPQTPHVMSKNPFALPTQLDQFDYMKPRIGTQALMIIMLEFPDSMHQDESTESYFTNLLYGDDPSVNGYFQEVSYGNYSFSNAGVFGWFMAPQTAEHYFGAHENYTTLAAASVQAAIDAGVQFDGFDTNGDDEITREELIIQMVFSSHPRLNLPWVMATRWDQQQDEGVTTPGGLEIDTWAVRGEEYGSMSLFAHELCHAALALPDLYGDDYGGDPSRIFTLMDSFPPSFTPHISPWAKIHLGWIEPVVVARSGRYTIPAVEQNPVAYVLYDPDHGVDEYYILENRWPEVSQYENGLPDRGLAIWHITEFYDDESFNFLKGRKMVAMKWAGGDNSLDEFPLTALWDCLETASCYDFTDISSPRDSHWEDGTSSGIEIRDIPDAGPMIDVDIVIPSIPILD